MIISILLSCAVNVSAFLVIGERQRQREREREGETETETERIRGRETEREREAARKRHRKSEKLCIRLVLSFYDD